MNTESISKSTEQLTKILLLASEQSTGLTGKLIKANVELKLKTIKDDSIGGIIDTFA
jgi:methylglyoxal synthase